MERRQAFCFRTPSSLLIAGPSGCGKTVFTTKLLLDNVESFAESPPSIHYCYGSWQKGGVLVMDDLMDEGSNDKRVLDLFTKHSHHQNITVLYLCQDLFPNGKFAKTISRNAHYVVAFKNPRDQLGIRNLLLQSFPTQWQEVLDTFRKVTERPFGYMLLDLHPASKDDQRVLSHLLKDEGFVRCHRFVS